MGPTPLPRPVRVLTTGSLLAALLVVSACSTNGAGTPENPAPARGSAPETSPQDAAAPGRALLAAAVANDGPEVRRLLGAGASPDHRDALDRPVLVAATRANAVEAASELILAGADVNAKDAISDSAFLHAGAEGLNEILALTLEHGADVASTNRYGGTALIPACERAHVETVEMLLATRAGPACWRPSSWATADGPARRSSGC
ncbi:ankyrin repeat domain-containing protein [Paeniglutamicibacter sp. NPDC012692]|uniref:ankyrin repeat domain-containing protein n=1 Tax=Paeniglutamicibacter sp. NPDC012692 TaxID=3364388 RepID=UPI0036C942D3